MNNVFTKDPQATLDYGFDWSDWLVVGDTIGSSSWDVPTGLTKVTESKTNTTTTVWISSGSPGVTYKVGNHITTVGGRADDRSLIIEVAER